MSNNNGEPIKRTLRERKFIEAYIGNCGNATEAYSVISPNVKRDSAKELGKRMVARVSLSVVEILDRTGLTDPVLSKKLLEGLNATKETGKGIQKADHNIIVKYLDMAFKLKAMYPADRNKLELTGKDGQPIGGKEVIILKEIVPKMCPLRLQCPIEKEVREAERLECIKNAKNKDKDKAVKIGSRLQ